jgi:excisionase family DNA binding protein
LGLISHRDESSQLLKNYFSVQIRIDRPDLILPYMELSSNSVPYYFEPLLNPKAAAALVGIHEKSLIRFARVGDVPAMRIGKLWRFRASELDSWLRSEAQLTRRSQ